MIFGFTERSGLGKISGKSGIPFNPNLGREGFLPAATAEFREGGIFTCGDSGAQGQSFKFLAQLLIFSEVLRGMFACIKMKPVRIDYRIYKTQHFLRLVDIGLLGEGHK